MTRAVGLTLAALLVLATPSPVGASGPEAYLAYRIRVARGEAHYRLDAGLSRLAEQRAQESSRAFRHRRLVEVPCGWGEVLGWVSLTGPDPAARWVMAAWRKSTRHWEVVQMSWAHYGVGAYSRDGRWYFAVVFAQCRLA
jgi:hypothetical protein